MKNLSEIQSVRLDQIVGGGQTIATLEDGRKAFVWGGLPGEIVSLRVTKKKSRMIEAIVTNVELPSKERVKPRDPDSYLSTSPWQIMSLTTENHYKAALIEEAFELHDIVLPNKIDIFSDDNDYHYRNKVEFSWYSDSTPSGDTLDLAFFRRGSKGKIIVENSALLPPVVMSLACEIRNFLRRKKLSARQLKTLLIRCDQKGNCVWQLYSKQTDCPYITAEEASQFSAQGGEVIYSDSRSPASIISERLLQVGDLKLTDSICNVDFNYVAESFFQVNLPIYEQALKDMSAFVDHKHQTVDLYSGVGTIGLTIGGNNCTLVELNPHAVDEMKANIMRLNIKATAVRAASEDALEYIEAEKIIIVDPPRAGLHTNVVDRLLDKKPPRIIYLSCNPVTQARDIALLCGDGSYGIKHHKGYNFFPHTPHIEHLVVLDRKN